MRKSAPLTILSCALALIRVASAQAPAEVPIQFQVDGGCRIYEVLNTPKGPKEHSYRDAGICEVDQEKETHLSGTDMDTGERLHIRITIREHTFTLHNPTSQTVSFLVDQKLPEGWVIDSDPAPIGVNGGLATFLVWLQPWETIHLHVGQRKQVEVKARP